LSENETPTQEQINAGLAQALQKQEKTTNEILEYLKQTQTAGRRGITGRTAPGLLCCIVLMGLFLEGLQESQGRDLLRP